MKFIKMILTAVLILSAVSCKKNEQTKPVTTNQNIQQQKNINQSPPPPPVIERQQNIDKKIAEEILAVVYENLNATIAEDSKRVLATIHKDSPQYQSTVQGLEYVFTNYDLEFDLEKTEVIEVTENDAKVHYIQTTRSVRGQGFINKRDEGIHHLKKQDGEWKIFKTENISTVPLQ